MDASVVISPILLSYLQTRNYIMNSNNNQGWIAVVLTLLTIPAIFSFLNNQRNVQYDNVSTTAVERDSRITNTGWSTEWYTPEPYIPSNTLWQTACDYIIPSSGTTSVAASVTTVRCCGCRWERQHWRRCLGRSGSPPPVLVRR